MYLERYDFPLRLVLLSDLHVGDGADRRLDDLRGEAAIRTKQGSFPEVAAVARDQDGKPYIPSTSLKGAVRDLVEDIDGRLFGAGPDETGQGATGGRLIFWRGRLDPTSLPAQDALDLPYWDPAKATYVGTHVSIDRQTGAAEEGKLYFREYVPAGAAFDFDACWLGRDDELESRVIPLLREMRGGFALGAASGAGFGRVALENDAITVRTCTFSIDGRRANLIEKTRPFGVGRPVDRNAQTIRIVSEGPFFIADPVRAAQLRKAHDGTPELGPAPDLVALRRGASLPELVGTSLLGALRTRASWLEQTRLGGPPDDPRARFDRRKGPGPLTSTQRLFGVTGWAKRLRISNIAAASTPTQPQDYPGIALDDFTQGTIAGALFLIQAPANLAFDIRFERGTSGDPELDERDAQLWREIERDIGVYGLKLGHSSGTGFGWFRRDDGAGAASAAEREQAHVQKV